MSDLPILMDYLPKFYPYSTPFRTAPSPAAPLFIQPPPLQHPFRAGQVIAEWVAFYSHADRLGKRFEDRLDLVMLVVAPAFDVEVAARCIAERLKEMMEHFRRHLPDLFPVELRIPHQPGTAAEIDEHLGFGLVHRQGKTIPLHPPFVGQGFCKSFAQRETR